MITISNNLYIAGENNMWKTDEDLNVLIQFNGTDTWVNGTDRFYLFFFLPREELKEVKAISIMFTGRI